MMIIFNTYTTISVACNGDGSVSYVFFSSFGLIYFLIVINPKMFSSKVRFNGMMIILSVIPLVIFYQINKNNRLLIYVHKKNTCMYYVMKALISILAITFMIYIKDMFA
jgi:hypothetical protein